MKHWSKGFTVVELAAVIMIIGILATVTIASFTNWQASIAKNAVRSDLLAASTALNNSNNFNNGYPDSLPSNTSITPGVVLEMTDAGVGSFCVNGYHMRYPDIRLSIKSDDKAKVHDYLCGGVSNGSTTGGTVPSSPIGVNVAPPFSQWTLTGPATVSSSTGELTLGLNGTATSPSVRVNGAAGVRINGQFYTNIQSTNSAIKPDGGWHISSNYYSADGVTPALNTAGTGQPGNGCARAVQLGAWNSSKTGDCVFLLGPAITYMKLKFMGPNSGYTSTDIKIKDVKLILN